MTRRVQTKVTLRIEGISPQFRAPPLMTILEQIHQHLTDTKANDRKKVGTRVSFLKITGPMSGPSEKNSMRNWYVEVYRLSSPDDELEASFQSPSLTEAAEDMLGYLRERDRANADTAVEL